MIIKKTVYLIASMLLGLLLASIVHSLIEIWYVNNLISKGIALQPQDIFGVSCFLPRYLHIFLFLSGLIGGYFLGRYWWRMVYIKHRHWRK